MSESRGAGGSRLGVRAVAPLAERTSAGGLGRGWRAEWQRAAARGSRDAGAACGWRAECGGTMRAAAGPLARRVEVMPPRLPRVAGMAGACRYCCESPVRFRCCWCRRHPCGAQSDAEHPPPSSKPV